MVEEIKSLKEEFEQGLKNLDELVSAAKGHAEAAEKSLAEGEAKSLDASKANADAISAAQTKLQSIGSDMLSAQKRLDDFEAKSNRHAIGSGSDSFGTVGTVLTNSEEYKSFANGNGAKHMSFRYSGEEYKALITSADDSAGVLPETYRVPGIVSAPRRQARMRDLFPVNRLEGTDSVTFVSETRFTDLSVLMVGASIAGASIALEVANANGFKVGSVITVGFGTANVETATVTATDSDASPNTVTAGPLAKVHAIGDEITASEFIYTPEAGLKPGSNVTFGTETQSVMTMASSLTVTRQIISDATQLRAHIDNRLMEALRLSEESQILYGSGSGNEIQGILTHTDVPVYLWSNGVSGDTKLDAIRRAMTIAQIAEYPVTGIVLHPTDWQDIVLAKTVDGAYQLGGVDGRSGITPNVWGIPVVVTTAIVAGTSLIGAFGQAAAIWDREDANIRISESHADHFRKNLAEVLAELRMTMTVYRPEAFVEVTFDSAPA